MDPNEQNQEDQPSGSSPSRRGRTSSVGRISEALRRTRLSLSPHSTSPIRFHRSSHDSPDNLSHSPEPPISYSKQAKARIFGNSRRGRGRRPGALSRSEVPTPGATADPNEEDPNEEIRGTLGREIALVTNYFRVRRDPGWTLYQYQAEFDPPLDETFLRKAYVRTQQQIIGAYIFDGIKLYATRRIPGGEDSEDIATFIVTKRDSTTVRVILKYQGPVDDGEPVYTQFYNLIVRKCLQGLGLEEISRNYFDSNMAIDFPALRIQLWPGYINGMQFHEEDVLLCVEVIHKVIRTEDVLSVIKEIKRSGRHRDLATAVLSVLQESIVMTHYNRNTYRVRGVDFNLTPRSCFTTHTGLSISYQDYYRSKYQLEIRDPDQPLLIAKQTKFDPRQKGKDEGLVKLIPEFCQFTGLTESMRANFSLMKELAKYLHMNPMDRVRVVMGYMTRLQGCRDLVAELAGWGFTFETELVRCAGRVLPPQHITFAEGTEVPNDKADWTTGFRSQKLLIPKPLNKWVIIVTKRDSDGIPNLVRTMQKVSLPLGFNISLPLETVTIQDNKMQTYVKAIDNLVGVEGRRRGIDMLFVCLATSAADCYAAVKQRLVVDYGVPSQCFLAKNMKSKGLMTIATKMCVQMCTKLGGEPWTVNFPLKNLMVVGYDTYAKGTPKVSAMVTALNPTFTKYFSTVFSSTTYPEKLKNMCLDLEKCINAYKSHNHNLPDWILIYRDGGEDEEIHETEIRAIEVCIENFYTAQHTEAPKFTYVIFTKRINTRLFADLGKDRVGNPPPGTIVDHTITKSSRYDFFMISAAARQGTVCPTKYNVVRDTSAMEPDKLQLLTNKLCHLYFNWSGTVAVPAPCQYALKLATLTSVAYQRPAHPGLAELLYYL